MWSVGTICYHHLKVSTRIHPNILILIRREDYAWSHLGNSHGYATEIYFPWTDRKKNGQNASFCFAQPATSRIAVRIQWLLRETKTKDLFSYSELGHIKKMAVVTQMKSILNRPDEKWIKRIILLCTTSRRSHCCPHTMTLKRDKDKRPLPILGTVNSML